MPTSIYLFKLRNLNIYNFPIAQLYENLNTKSFERCTFNIDPNGFIKVFSGNFVQSQTTNFEKEFRYLDWQKSLSSLEQSLSLASEKNQCLVFGSYLSEQIDFLKNHFGPTVMTIGINYQKNSYQKLLNHKARFHIHLLLTNQLTQSELDKNLLSTLTDDELVNYYASAFDQQMLIPHSEISNCDYNIALDDFFNISSMRQHFSTIGVPFTGSSERFYNQWLSSIDFS